MQSTCHDPVSLNAHIRDVGKGALLVAHRTCSDYEGMVLAIMIVFNARESQYQLDLQWMSFGLDPYGDTLQESYIYRFERLDVLLEYLKTRYHIEVTDIPIKYKFDPSEYPDPIKDERKRPLFEEAWQRFQVDFGLGNFKEPSLDVVYSSVE